MNWIEFVWYVMAGACLTLCGIYLLAWLRRRGAVEHLSLAAAAAAVFAMAVLEPMALQARSPDEFARVVLWLHVPAAVFVVAMVPYVWLRYRVGNLWLGGAAIVVRLASLIANFTTGVNVNFVRVDALAPVRWLGETAAVPHGVVNPWMALASTSLLLLILFLLHGVWQLWHRTSRPDAKQATMILLGAAFFLFVAMVWAALVATGTLKLPILVVPPFAGFVLAMAFDLGGQQVRVPELSRHLAQSEANRHVAETQLKLARLVSGLGTWTWDHRGGTLHCSESALGLLGLPLHLPVDPERLSASITAEHRASLLQGYEEALRGSGEFGCEFGVALGDGRGRWLFAHGYLERDTNGEPLLMHGILIDVTQRREADQRFRRVIEAMPVAILLVRKDGHIAFANHRAERVFGYPLQDLCTMHVDALLPSARREGHAKLRDEYLANATTRDMAASREVFGLRRDGSMVAIEVNLSVMQTQSGQHVLAIVNDISARKQAEQEAGERRNELAHLSRVALLTELSGSLAHELNQPLTAILSNAQAGARFLARNPPDLDEVRECLRNIVESDKRAGEIIRRLRAMLRKDPPDFIRLDLNEVVVDVLHIVHSDLVTRNVDVQLKLQASLPATMGDRIQLQQVLLNLIMNACDAMASCAEQPALTIQTREFGEGWVRLDVVDSGRGIPGADLERIFLPFVSSKSAGLGLGLAVCRTIVQAHGGRLWAENNAVRGAVLRMALRAVEPTP